MHERWMKRAVRLARLAAKNGEVPVGAVLLSPTGALLSVGCNQKEALQSPTRHAEMVAIERAAKKLKAWRLSECTLYVTLEPCVMCAGAIIQARVSKVIFGALDSKGGGLLSLYQLGQDPRLNHRLDAVVNLDHLESSQILTQFFRAKRK